MTASRRAIVAQHRMPEFDRERGSLRVLEVIETLLADGWSVTYLTLTPPSEQRYVRHLARLGVATLVGTEQAVQSELIDLDPDLAVIAFWHVGEQLIPLLRELVPAIKIVVDSIDLHFVRNSRRKIDEATTVQPWIDDATADEMRRELNVYCSADAVFTVSNAERATLAALGGDGLLVRSVPLSERTLRSDRSFADRRGIVFVGNFRHLPNIEAVGYLCQEILPRLDPDLLAEHPVSLVGNELDERVRAAARMSGVQLVGWVPEIEPYLHRARVSVAPLLHGAGVKGKVLQSLMAGTPMVATPLAIEGTDIRSGAHVLVADTAAAFARSITAALTDADVWQRLADDGHLAAENDHSVTVARQHFRDAIADVLASSHRLRDGGDSRRWLQHYERVRIQVSALVNAHAADDALVLVLSGGDDALLAATNRRAVHFPADENGQHSFHPVDGAAAVTMLDAHRARGATHLVLPSTAYWWLHQYPQLRSHLADRWVFVAESDEVRIWAAKPSPDGAGAEILVVASAAHSDHHRLTVVSEMPDDIDRFDRVVVAPGHRLDARWLDRLLGLQARLGLDVAQAVAAIGSAATLPATVEQRGVVARRTRAVSTTLPLVFARRAFGLLGRLFEGLRRYPHHLDLRFGMIDGSAIVAVPATAPLPLSPLILTDEGNVADRDAWAMLDVSVDGFIWQGMPRPSQHRRLSVVIATFNRAELLEECLNSLVDQSLSAQDWEVIVVDDGSTDATPEVMRRWAGVLPLRWARISHAGRSAAKNMGILAAVGDIVLMLDDDDVADQDLLLEHVKAHDDDPDPTVAVLGYTDWAPGIAVTPLMHFVTERAAMLFAYHEIADGDRVGWRYFWEGRLSCKRSILIDFGLHDQRLAYTIDIELGFRLAHGPGLTVVHRRSAISHMARSLTYDEFLARSEAKGRAQHQFATIHPTDEVRAYCHVGTAEQEWAAAAATFEADRRRVLELEATVADRPDLLDELHGLYLRTLRGINRRGVLDAAQQASTTVQGTGPAISTAPVPALSIVIPVWSVTEELADMAVRTIERIWDVSQIPTEVIVVDNGSPHRRAMNATILIENDQNEGVAPAWNSGIARARADTIVVLNSDVTVEPGWDVALELAAREGRRIVFPYTDHADGLGPRRSDQAGTAGWCFALSRRVADEIGEFDESFRPAFFEDADYWTRAHAIGVDLTPVPAAVVRHARRSTARHHPDMDLLFQAHRMKYSWKYGIDPTSPPPYWHREVVEFR